MDLICVFAFEACALTNILSSPMRKDVSMCCNNFHINHYSNTWLWGEVDCSSYHFVAFQPICLCISRSRHFCSPGPTQLCTCVHVRHWNVAAYQGVDFLPVASSESEDSHHPNLRHIKLTVIDITNWDRFGKWFNFLSPKGLSRWLLHTSLNSYLLCIVWRLGEMRLILPCLTHLWSKFGRDCELHPVYINWRPAATHC